MRTGSTKRSRYVDQLRRTRVLEGDINLATVASYRASFSRASTLCCGMFLVRVTSLAYACMSAFSLPFSPVKPDASGVDVPAAMDGGASGTAGRGGRMPGIAGSADAAAGCCGPDPAASSGPIRAVAFAALSAGVWMEVFDVVPPEAHPATRHRIVPNCNMRTGLNILIPYGNTLYYPPCMSFARHGRMASGMPRTARGGGRAHGGGRSGQQGGSRPGTRGIG